MITKTFQFKGQMINYFNKVKANPTIDFIVMGLFPNLGYAVQYSYKSNSKRQSKS